MHKDNAVGNVVAETGRDLVFMTSARLSDLSVPLKGEVRRSPEQSAWQPIARSGKFVRRAYQRRALGCEETTVSCFLPSWSTLLFDSPRAKVEKDASIKSFVAIVCQHLFEGCNGCT